MIHADTPRCHSLSGAGRLDIVALGATVNALGCWGFWRQCQGLPWRVTGSVKEALEKDVLKKTEFLVCMFNLATCELRKMSRRLLNSFFIFPMFFLCLLGLA